MIPDEISNERHNLHYHSVSVSQHNGILVLERDPPNEFLGPANIVTEEVNIITITLDESRKMDLDILTGCLDPVGSSSHLAINEALPPDLQNIFEPTRLLNDFGPPKRFFRTFWRSLTRKYCAFSRTEM